jgi:hypothetical protein
MAADLQDDPHSRHQHEDASHAQEPYNGLTPLSDPGRVEEAEVQHCTADGDGDVTGGLVPSPMLMFLMILH